MSPVVVTRPGTALPPSSQLATLTGMVWLSEAAVKVRLGMSLPPASASTVPQVPLVTLNAYSSPVRTSTFACCLPSSPGLSGTPAASQLPSDGTDPETYSTCSLG